MKIAPFEFLLSNTDWIEEYKRRKSDINVTYQYSYCSTYIPVWKPILPLHEVESELLPIQIFLFNVFYPDYYFFFFFVIFGEFRERAARQNFFASEP